MTAQLHLFPGAAAPAAKLEVHEHAFISGARAHSADLVHSHPGGDAPHRHPDTGPACYTIDKDEWSGATGLKGGGRRQFTDACSGEQLPILQLATGQGEFAIVYCDPPAGHKGTGGGIYAAERMRQAFRMDVVVIDGRKKR